jgi:hypothetical protein
MSITSIRFIFQVFVHKYSVQLYKRGSLTWFKDPSQEKHSFWLYPY